MSRLLIVEDEPRLLRNLQDGLEEEGYEVLTAATGEEGCALAATQSIDLVMLDLMLPGRSGLDVLRQLRKSGFAQPILILTAKDSIDDRVQGLDHGADDYLVKPFAFAELLARVRALLRRHLPDEPTVLRAADLEMNLLTGRVVRAGIELELSTREHELLEYLLRHADETLPRETIARDVWKESGSVETNVIDVYVNYLRKKVERPGLRPLIHTVRGVGYCLREDA